MSNIAGCQHHPDGSITMLTPDELPDFTQPPDWFTDFEKIAWSLFYRRFCEWMPHDLAWYCAAKEVERGPPPHVAAKFGQND